MDSSGPTATPKPRFPPLPFEPTSQTVLPSPAKHQASATAVDAPPAPPRISATSASKRRLRHERCTAKLRDAAQQPPNKLTLLNDMIACLESRLALHEARALPVPTTPPGSPPPPAAGDHTFARAQLPDSAALPPTPAAGRRLRTPGNVPAPRARPACRHRPGGSPFRPPRRLRNLGSS